MLHVRRLLPFVHVVSPTSLESPEHHKDSVSLKSSGADGRPRGASVGLEGLAASPTAAAATAAASPAGSPKDSAAFHFHLMSPARLRSIFKTSSVGACLDCTSKVFLSVGVSALGRWPD